MYTERFTYFDVVLYVSVELNVGTILQIYIMWDFSDHGVFVI